MDIIEKFRKYLEENYDTTGNQNTIKSYYNDMLQFIKYFREEFGEEIVDFSRADFTEYRNYIKEDRGLKFSTINRKTAALSVYEDFLIEKKIRKEETKIIRKRDFYKIDRPYITKDMLPNNTIKKIRLKAGKESKRDYAIFVLFDVGGLRVSELLAIEIERDLDFKMYLIHIIGKGNKIRSIFMEQIIYDAIMDYLPERERMLDGRANKYLFVSNKTANTGKKMARTSINKLLEQYCKKVQGNKINPHILRHHSATEKYENGYTDMMLKKFLGQTSNATDIYTHPGGEKYRDTPNG